MFAQSNESVLPDRSINFSDEDVVFRHGRGRRPETTLNLGDCNSSVRTKRESGKNGTKTQKYNTAIYSQLIKQHLLEMQKTHLFACCCYENRHKKDRLLRIQSGRQKFSGKDNARVKVAAESCCIKDSTLKPSQWEENLLAPTTINKKQEVSKV